MPHKIKKAFNNALTFEKLYQAHIRAKQHKANRNELIRFEFNLENNLINLLKNIQNNTYHLGKYTTFIIYEPKRREIMSLPYRDRIVHQWYVEEFLKPYFLPKLIHTSFACITNKGTHKAVETIQHYMRIYYRKNPNFWILKCDIKKFFYSIDKNILFNILKKGISDKKLLRFTHQLIFENQDANSKGIPIGNYTSQFFANIYLNELDQYLKHQLHIRYYVRYMDDFILLLDSKEECKRVKTAIEVFLNDNLELELNHKSGYYPNHFGVNFCGYRTFTTHRLLRKKSKVNMYRKINSYNKLYHKNKLDIPKVMLSINSWLGHASFASTYSLQKKMLNKCHFLYTPLVYEREQEELEKLIDSNNNNNNNNF